jgi:hypothetical protein
VCCSEIYLTNHYSLICNKFSFIISNNGNEKKEEENIRAFLQQRKKAIRVYENSKMFMAFGEEQQTD